MNVKFNLANINLATKVRNLNLTFNSTNNLNLVNKLGLTISLDFINFTQKFA